MEKEIRVAIVAPVHNRKETTLQCLRSISRLENDSFSVQTIIVDDGSTDGTGEAIRTQFPYVEVIHGNGDLWFTEGTNVGVRAALKYDPNYVLMINDDQVFDSAAVKNMVECAESHPRSIVGPLLLLWDQPHKVFLTSPVWSIWMGGWRHWNHQTVWTVPDGPWEVDLIVGNCVLVPVTAIREVGLMNSTLFPNFGDVEYTPRMRRKGWSLLIEPRARTFCQQNTVPPRIRHLSMREKVEALLIDKKHPHNLRRRFWGSWAGAPNRLSGFLAFLAFVFRVLVGKTRDIDRPDYQEIEKPLKEKFARATWPPV